MAAQTKTKTIDEYLAAFRDDQRAALQKLRQTIRAAAPKAEECISYQLAAFRQDGMLVAFGATANHCAFYVMSSSTLDAYQDELEGYDISKGTIRFQADQPLPVALVRKLVKARMAENTGRQALRTPARRRGGALQRAQVPGPQAGRQALRKAGVGPKGRKRPRRVPQ